MSTNKAVESFFTKKDRSSTVVDPVHQSDPQNDRDIYLHNLEKQISHMKQRDHDIWYVKTIDRDADKQDRAREELKKLGIPFREKKTPAVQCRTLAETLGVDEFDIMDSEVNPFHEAMKRATKRTY